MEHFRSTPPDPLPAAAYPTTEEGSPPAFPENRENNSEFVFLDTGSAGRLSKLPFVFSALRANPVRTEQRNPFSEQGIFRPDKEMPKLRQLDSCHQPIGAADAQVTSGGCDAAYLPPAIPFPTSPEGRESGRVGVRKVRGLEGRVFVGIKSSLLRITNSTNISLL
jgi:hypothetical protein